MVLTNKVTYLLTEYQQTCQPPIKELTNYAQVLKSLNTKTMVGTSFDTLKPANKTSSISEVDALIASTILAMTPKIIALGQQIITKASSLLVTNKDHVVDMTENVDDDARIGETGAQTTSLKTTITGMVAILPGGGSGAAVVTAENAPTLIQLVKENATKAIQVASATKELPTLAQSAVELTQFTKLLKTLT